MSRSNWRNHAPLGFGIAFVAALLLIAGLINHSKQAERRDGGTQQHPQHTLQSVKDAGVPVVGGQEPTPSNPPADRKEWREEQDLKAQRQMADWAKYAVFAAFATVCVTALGVWYVRLTLDATRVALREAEKSSNAAVAMARAMVGLELPVVHARPMGIDLLAVSAPLPPGPPGGRPYGGTHNSRLPTRHSIVGDIPFRNFGRTPAFLTAIALGFSVAKELTGEPVYTRHIRLNPDTIIRPEPREDPREVQVDFGIDLLDDQITVLQNDNGQLWLYCALFYEDFMRAPHESRYCWRWAQRPKGLVTCSPEIPPRDS